MPGVGAIALKMVAKPHRKIVMDLYSFVFVLFMDRGQESVGTSGCSLHKRGAEHLEGFRAAGARNPMAKHYVAEHPEVERGT